MKHVLAEKDQAAGTAVPVATLVRSAEGMGTTSPSADRRRRVAARTDNDPVWRKKD